MGDKGGINNYDSYKLNAEDLTRPLAIGPANFVLSLFSGLDMLYIHIIYIYIYM